MKSRPCVVGLGEILWDLYPNEKYLGGATANVAIHAHRLGAKSIVASTVGQDLLGEEIIKNLVEQGLVVDYIQKSTDWPTGTVDVKLNREGIPHFICSKNTAFDHFQWDTGLETLAGKSDAVIVGTLAQRNEESRRTIQKFIQISAGTVVFDANFREWNDTVNQILRDTLHHTDILKLNENECHQIKKASSSDEQGIFPFLNKLIDAYHLKLIALSLGQRGCLLTDGKEHVLSPGIKIKPLDTTGCGDAFVAGLIIKYMNNASLEEIAEFANHLGAFMATMKGAVPEYTRSDLIEFRDSYRERYEIII